VGTERLRGLNMDYRVFPKLAWSLHQDFYHTDHTSLTSSHPANSVELTSRVLSPVLSHDLLLFGAQTQLDRLVQRR
jgi:hypothetical protein